MHPGATHRQPGTCLQPPATHAGNQGDSFGGSETSVTLSSPSVAKNVISVGATLNQGSSVRSSPVTAVQMTVALPTSGSQAGVSECCLVPLGCRGLLGTVWAACRKCAYYPGRCVLAPVGICPCVICLVLPLVGICPCIICWVLAPVDTCPCVIRLVLALVGICPCMICWVLAPVDMCPCVVFWVLPLWAFVLVSYVACFCCGGVCHRDLAWAIVQR